MRKTKFGLIFTLLFAFVCMFSLASCDNKTKETTTENTGNNSNNEESSKTTDEKKKEYSVTLDNKVSTLDVTINVRKLDVVDGVPTPSDIDFSLKYEKGTTVFVQVLNDSTERLMVSAKNGDKELDSSIIAAKAESATDSTAGGLFGLELTADMTIVLDKAPETATITINEAESANTTQAINKLHAYDPEDEDLADYNTGSEVAIGKKMTIYEFNYASAVNLTVTQDGVEIINKNYAKITDFMSGHNEDFDITIEGNIVITVTNITEAPEGFYTLNVEGEELVDLYIGDFDFYDGDILEASTFNFTASAKDKNVKVTLTTGETTLTQVVAASKSYTFKDVEVAADVNVKIEETEEQPAEQKAKATYTITIAKPADMTGITCNIRYLDENMTPVDIVSGTKYEEGTAIFAQVINTTANALKITASKGTEVLQSATIEAKPADDDASYGGLMNVVLSGDVAIKLEVVEAEEPVVVPAELYGEYEGEYGTSVVISATSIKFDSTETAMADVEVEYDSETKIYTIKAGSDNLIYDEDSKELSNGGYEVLTKKVVAYSVTIENKTEATVNVTTMVDGVPTIVATGNEVAENTGLYVQVNNASAKAVKVSIIKADGTVLATTTVAAKPADEDSSVGGIMGDDYTGVKVTSNVKVLVEEAVEEYNVTVTNETGCSVQAFYGADFTDLENNTKIQAGSYEFTLGASYQESDLKITLKINGEVKKELTVSAWEEVTEDIPLTVNGNVELIVELAA